MSEICDAFFGYSPDDIRSVLRDILRTKSRIETESISLDAFDGARVDMIYTTRGNGATEKHVRVKIDEYSTAYPKIESEFAKITGMRLGIE